jgi:hypothetical protein
MVQVQVLGRNLRVVRNSILLLSTITLGGCSTFEHDPRCKCECKENNSYFECSSNIDKTEVDVK